MSGERKTVREKRVGVVGINAIFSLLVFRTSVSATVCSCHELQAVDAAPHSLLFALDIFFIFPDSCVLQMRPRWTQKDGEREKRNSRRWKFQQLRWMHVNV